MLPSFMTSQSFLRLRYPRVMDHGTEVVDNTATPDALELFGSIQPGTGETDLLNRDGAEIVYTILTGPDADVKHDDRITLDDGDYYVNGAPERWQTGVLDHTVIRLSRWSG